MWSVASRRRPQWLRRILERQPALVVLLALGAGVAAGLGIHAAIVRAPLADLSVPAVVPSEASLAPRSDAVEADRAASTRRHDLGAAHDALTTLIGEADRLVTGARAIRRQDYDGWHLRAVDALLEVDRLRHGQFAPRFETNTSEALNVRDAVVKGMQLLEDAKGDVDSAR